MWIEYYSRCCRAPTFLASARASSGSRLLSGDGGGHVRCWGMTEGLVGGWECQAEAALPGEPLVTLAWLHNGVKLNLHPDKVVQFAC